MAVQMQVSIGPDPNLFKCSYFLVRGSVNRKGREFLTCVKIPSDTLNPEQFARPLLVAAFAAGRWIERGERTSDLNRKGVLLLDGVPSDREPIHVEV